MTVVEPESGSQIPWSRARKWSTLITAYFVCFTVGINSTAILSAAEEISSDFNINNESFDYSFFIVTAWNVGAAVIPLLVLPVMEDFGVRPLYLTTYALFVIFVMVQAVAPNFATIIVSRVFAGACGGVLQDVVAGLAADVWDNDRQRESLSISMFVFHLLGGVTFGPVLGGVVIKYLHWRWILYIQLIIYGTLAPLVVLFIHETRKDNVAKKKVSIKAKMDELSSTLVRSSHMLCTDFVVSSFTLWSAFSFGTAFMLTQSIPIVYGDLYGWPEWKMGVVQIAVFIGISIGMLCCIFQDTAVFEHLAVPNPTEENDPQPEARLFTSIPASLLGLTAGFFIYAWTSDPKDHYPWPLPTLGLLLIGIGIMVIVQAVTTYITGCFGSQANSAVSAAGFGENMFAAFLPLATKSMYRSMGSVWASSLLGFIGLLISCAPIVLVIFGKTIRRKSKFAE